MAKDTPKEVCAQAMYGAVGMAVGRPARWELAVAVQA